MAGLDPTIVLASTWALCRPLVRERYAPRRLVTEAVRSARDLEELLRVMPRRVDLLSEQLGRGELTLGIDVRSLGQALRKLDAVVNRLAFSVVVAAIIVGSALILAAGERAAMFRLPFVDATCRGAARLCRRRAARRMAPLFYHPLARALR